MTKLNNQFISSYLMGEPYGFTLSPHDLYFDKDKPCPSCVVCLERKHVREGGAAPEYQYLTLTEYDGTFVEACFYAYSQPFNSKAKLAQRQAPLVARLLRPLDDILLAVQ